MIPPHAEDDRLNFSDLSEIAAAVEEAQKALRMAMEGRGRDAREQFMFHVGFARGRLSRVSDRIYRDTGP